MIDCCMMYMIKQVNLTFFFEDLVALKRAVGVLERNLLNFDGTIEI